MPGKHEITALESQWLEQAYQQELFGSNAPLSKEELDAMSASIEGHAPAPHTGCCGGAHGHAGCCGRHRHG